jgi:hypothetical protein
MDDYESPRVQKLRRNAVTVHDPKRALTDEELAEELYEAHEEGKGGGDIYPWKTLAPHKKTEWLGVARKARALLCP